MKCLYSLQLSSAFSKPSNFSFFFFMTSNCGCIETVSCYLHKLPLGCNYIYLTPKAPIATKVVCFSRLLKCLRSLYGKQCGPRSDCSYRSGSTLFASILNSSVMLGNYLQQTTSAGDIYQTHFSWRFKG